MHSVANIKAVCLLHHNRFPVSDKVTNNYVCAFSNVLLYVYYSINTVTVGFAETSYTVPEGGSVEVCVRVISPDGDLGRWYMGFVEIIPSDSAPPPSTFHGLNEASEHFETV